MVNAIILAGTSHKKKRLIDEHDGKGPKNKSLVTVYKTPVILNVLDALKNSEHINDDKIAIVGPKKDLTKIIEDKKIHIRQEKSFIENCAGTYDYLSKNKEKTLFITCDLPFITSGTLDNFVEQCDKYDARFYFPLINIRNIPKKIEPFKKTKKFHLKKRGYYRTTNMALFQDSEIEDRKPFENQIREAFEARRITSKKAILNLFLSGLKFKGDILKYFLPIGLKKIRGLTEKEIETSIIKKLHVPFKLIEITDWDAAADIDYQEDFEFFKRNYHMLKKEYS